MKYLFVSKISAKYSTTFLQCQEIEFGLQAISEIVETDLLTLIPFNEGVFSVRVIKMETLVQKFEDILKELKLVNLEVLCTQLVSKF